MGLRPVTSLWTRALRGVVLLWWQWARAELQAKNPAHEDLPMVVRRIRELQR